MKKLLSLLVLCILSMNILNLPVFGYTEVDYSSYIGDWQWISENAGEDRFSLGSADLKIMECTEQYVNFTFGVTSYRFFDEISGRVPMVDNTATLTATGRNGWPWTVTLRFYDTGIWFETDVKENGLGMMTKPDFQLKTRTIEEKEITVTVNGVPLAFDQPPVMVDDRVMVPMRKVFEALGADVYWDEEEWIGARYQRVTAIKKNELLQLEQCLDNSDGWSLYKRGLSQDSSALHPVSLYVQPVIVNDRTMISVRAVSEALGARVDWNEAEYTVVIEGDTGGERRPEAERQRMEAYTADMAYDRIKNQYMILLGTDGEPHYDEKGKYYLFMVSSNGRPDGASVAVRVYDDGMVLPVN